VPLRTIVVSGLIAVLSAILISAYIIASNRPPGASGAMAATEFVTFARFDTKADVIITASADGSSQRKLIEIPHAAEFGIVPALSPDGGHFAYTVLPPSNLAPAPDSPAQLWVASLDGSPPSWLGDGFDLLVKPLWSPDGTSVIARRPGSDGSFTLIRVDVRDGSTATAVTSLSAPFPVAFDSFGGLLYASLSPAGTDLFRLDQGVSSTVAHLSDDLTRDWTLSPDGSRLAFVALSQSDQQMTSTIDVLDLESLALTHGESSGNAFGPAWSAGGLLSFGRLSASGGSIVAGETSIAAARGGFDAPLAWSKSSAIAVRSFESPSLSAPGRERLAVLTPSGARRTIATGEVTFIGWTYR
jgi:hypothetical protein